MTAYDSDLVTNNGAVPITKNSVNVDGGRVRVSHATITQDFAQNDTLNVVALPSGARILGILHNGTFGVGSLTMGYTINDGSSRTVVTAYDASSDGVGVYKGSEYTTALAEAATLVCTFAAANPPSDGAGSWDVYWVLD